MNQCHPIIDHTTIDQNNDVNLLHEQTGLILEGEGSSNNVAEWGALLQALTYIQNNNLQGTIKIFGDSLLVISQINGSWKCKKEHLRPYLMSCRQLLENRNWTAEWICRKKNQKADNLSKTK